ncbi:hypothetical protein [Neobacillus mesonae]|uniref:hypothetical protein n=1 Tax=Neobacillus mesonae TaxID=1193713 RepID=UPI00203FD58E|nr:hypothetical protein [Neobacillus mesonae]MCM3567182.1 hypothetical protein [Neobacillus mesonae]
MKKWLFPSLMALTMLAAGCQNKDNVAENTSYDLQNDKSAPNYMSNQTENRNNNPDFMTNRGKDEQHYVENDITNQNPNFLDLDRTGSGGEAGASNEGNDIKKAKDVVAATNEFVTDSVWINGDRMWVSVYKKGMLSDREKIAAESRLHKKLVTALPRYNIEVRVKEDRR